MTHKIYKILGTALICMAGYACQDNAWDDHYAAPGDGTSDKTLLQLCEENPELSKFTAIVRENGLDKLLASSQTFTIFAPTNAAMEAFELTSDTLSQFLNNHICRYTYTLGDVLDAEEQLLRIKMLNEKYQNLENVDGALLFGNYGKVLETQGAGNGVLNVIDNIIPFYRNIYEEIQNGERTDSIAKYLGSMDEYTFNATASTIIGVNENGETVYGDSVMEYSNPWMKVYGDIYKEDSVYTMLIPSNDAWIAQYDKLKEYYRTFGVGTTKVSGIKVTGEFEIGSPLADSLTDVHTREAIVQDLVFRKSVDVEAPDGDSLVSTADHVFHAPQYLFAGAEKRDVSNGQMYVTDELKFKASESWQNEIRVEAENSSNYATQYCGSVSSRSVEEFPQFSGMVSDNKFLLVTPSNLSFQKNTVRFALPNTLAGTYNIYIVTLPASAVDTTNAANPDKMLSTKLNFYLTYVHEDGTLKEDAAIKTESDFGGGQTATPTDSDKPAFETDAYNVKKMLVASNFRFPYANYTASPFSPTTEEKITTSYLRVECIVTSSADLKKYEKNLRIDCIILEPVNE
ncbi:MAG: fasciclin domain-containing protein [Coprobacter sp.]|nr:fasciclin domain-containing protein [Coprobacter sp.]